MVLREGRSTCGPVGDGRRDSGQGEVGDWGLPELVDRLLQGPSARTTQAYGIDVNDFARWRGCSREEAVRQLLKGGAENARQVVLGFVGHLRRQGRAPATIRRRLATLGTLVRRAESGSLIDWWLDVGDWESVGDDPETSGENVAYVLPRGPAEVVRLDLQHYALEEAVHGHYLAPVEGVERILDVGAGTGQWGYDIVAVSDKALVVGLDLVGPKPDGPARYHAVRGNVLQGLPFRSDTFDFVHQRFLFSGVPVAAWPSEVRELARVCRVGGWVELVEGATHFERPGPATERLSEMLLRVNQDAGLDAESVVFRSLHRYLADAGLAAVERRWVELPIGEWGGKVGSLMTSDIRALFSRMSARFAVDLHVPLGECVELVRAAQQEWEQFHTTYPLAVAWGRKDKRDGE